MTQESEQFNFEEDGTPLSRPSGKQGANLVAAPDTGEEDELVIETVKCEICSEVIGKCKMENFAVPMTGFMFISKDSKHGYPRPFVRDFPWVDLRCPICHNRPFKNENFFMNAEDERCGNSIECDVPGCGKFLKNKLALYGHRSAAHRSKK